MPLFRRNLGYPPDRPATATATTTTTSTVEDPAPAKTGGGLFSSRRGSTQDQNVPPSTTRSTRHLFSKHDSLSQAQAKLRTAQEHEAAADRALVQSRQSVKAAKQEIARLEREAKEEQRQAKAHVNAASKIRKEGDKLGRHL